MAPTVEEYWRRLEPYLQPFSAEEQRVAVTLYRELAKGQPVDAARLGLALGIPSEAARALLQRRSLASFVYPDAESRVVGFGGLVTVPMHHRFEIDGRVLSTWCAWDALFIPEILARPAQVTSADPESGEPVRLVVTPEQIESVDPAEAVISFVLPDAQAFGESASNVMARFCHFIFFFASHQSGERWTARRPGTFLYSLDSAFALAKRLNARNFSAILPPNDRG